MCNQYAQTATWLRPVFRYKRIESQRTRRPDGQSTVSKFRWPVLCYSEIDALMDRPLIKFISPTPYIRFLAKPRV